MLKCFFISIVPFFLFSTAAFSQSFVQAKYGGDFLSVGGGARPLGMGSAYVSLVNDVTAGYWNPAGLADLKRIEVAYMHSERFNGIVGYDYGAVSFPVSTGDGVLALSFFRQGVDGIKNTLAVWDPNGNQPIPGPNTVFPEFSDNDYAFFISYSKPFSSSLSWGTTAKILHSKIGPFASAWGYSLDFGILYRSKLLNWGLNLMNIPTLFKFWDINRAALQKLTLLGNAMPTGQNEIVLPSVKTGISKTFHFNDIQLVTSLDTDILFENRRTYDINVGRISFEPHFGAEVSYKNHVALRAGLTDFSTDRSSHLYMSPTLGAGLMIGHVHINYGFASFSGITKDLGFTHRISVRVAIKPPKRK